MNFEVHGRLGIIATDKMKKRRGLQPGGAVQRYIDNAVIKQMEPYIPRADNGGFLSTKAALLGTKIGSGLVHMNGPYAKFQHYGKVMIYEPTGSTYAPRGEKKVVTETDLKYNGAPMRGAMFFNRMKAAKGQDILRGAQAVAEEENV